MVGRFLLLSPHWELQGFTRVGSCWWSINHGMEPSKQLRWEQQAVGLQYGSDIEPGDQAGKKPIYSTAKRKVAPGLSLNGAPGAVGRVWGSAGTAQGN